MADTAAAAVLAQERVHVSKKHDFSILVSKVKKIKVSFSNTSTEPKTWNLDLRTWTLELVTWILELGTWNLELRIGNVQVLSCDLVLRARVEPAQQYTTSTSSFSSANWRRRQH